jgi:hypothetical protein
MLAASLGGCGSDSPTFIDAAPSFDGSIDAPIPGTVTVTTLARCCNVEPGSPVADIAVFVIQPDGTAGPTGRTNASGVITLDGVLPGASVTAVYPNDDDGNDLVTVVAVKPGDQLRFGEAFDYYAGAETAATATFPIATGAWETSISHPCGTSYVYGDNQTQATLWQYDSCQGAGADFLFMQTSADTGELFRSTVLRDLEFPDGATIAIDSWTPTASLAIDVTGIPALVENANIAVVPILNRRYTRGSWQGMTPEAGTASATLPVPTGTDGFYTSVELERRGDVGPQVRYQVAAAAATQLQAPFTQIPWVGEVSSGGARGAASWLKVGDQAYDGAVARVWWDRYVPDGGEGGNNEYHRWTIILPPGVTSFSWNDPPPVLAEVAPTKVDNISADVYFVDLSTAEGYDGFRALPEWVATCPDCAAFTGELTGTATVSYSADGGEGFVSARKKPYLTGYRARATTRGR